MRGKQRLRNRYGAGTVLDFAARLGVRMRLSGGIIVLFGEVEAEVLVPGDSKVPKLAPQIGWPLWKLNCPNWNILGDSFRRATTGGVGLGGGRSWPIFVQQCLTLGPTWVPIRGLNLLSRARCGCRCWLKCWPTSCPTPISGPPLHARLEPFDDM